MRNSLPNKPRRIECGVINLDDDIGPGTHWVAYNKEQNDVIYFDSYGDLKPPIELRSYLGSDCRIFYNYKRYQSFGTFICGHLCLEFLLEQCKIKCEI